MLAGLGAFCVHAAVLAIATLVGADIAREVTKPALVSQIVEIEMPAAPAPRPEKPSEAAPSPTTRVATAREPPPSAAPAAAQAGRVLAAADDVIDFGDSFVVGKGDNYAGGTTETNGTARHAVQDLEARISSAPAPAKSAVSEVDHSRAPQLAGGSSWDCPFPAEADDAGLDHAVVTLRIEVAADGHVVQVNAARDPGHGFGREAKRCALGKRWAPGLDRDGHATSVVTRVNVRFDRE